jgi:general secretion pathway protein G
MTSAMSPKIFRCGKEKGFTLIELLIVITIIGILAAIAAPSYRQNVIKAREAVLLEDLFQMRHAIDAYFADNDRYPSSLTELVEKKYLRSIPRDPFTRKSDTWVTVQADPLSDYEAAREGVFDVHSGSKLVGLNGIPYQQW